MPHSTLNFLENKLHAFYMLAPYSILNGHAGIKLYSLTYIISHDGILVATNLLVYGQVHSGKGI